MYFLSIIKCQKIYKIKIKKNHEITRIEIYFSLRKFLDPFIFLGYIKICMKNENKNNRNIFRE